MRGASGPGEPTPPLSPHARTRATWVLIAARAGYSYNWFDVGPALPRIGATFGVGPADWGLLVAAFLVGAGAFQVPAGFLARRYGARSLSLVGLALLSAAGVGGAFSPTFDFLLASRVVAGVGAGLFFSPAIGLVASLFPAGQRGVPVGAFSSAFSAGAAVGLLGTALLVPAVDWRAALAIGGLGLAALTALAAFVIPRSAGASPPGPSAPARAFPPRSGFEASGRSASRSSGSRARRSRPASSSFRSARPCAVGPRRWPAGSA